MGVYKRGPHTGLTSGPTGNGFGKLLVQTNAWPKRFTTNA